MVKKSDKDIQLSFEFDNGNQKVRFVSIKGHCKCGYSGEFMKADVVIEMTVLCPECGSVIKIV